MRVWHKLKNHTVTKAVITRTKNEGDTIMFAKKLLPLAALLLLGANAHAAISLEFAMPTGTVSATDNVEVWLTLSTDTGFTFDASDPDGDNSYGGAIDPAEVPTGGFSPDANMGMGGFIDFDFIEFAGASISASCSGSFVIDSSGDCGLGGAGTENYTFAFGSAADWAPGGELTLGAGDSITFLWGTFTPVAGGAAAGTYDYFDAGIGIFFQGVGFDDFGEEVFASSFANLASTCASGDSSCAFTRTVAPVPVPAAVWLFASALIGLSGMSRRRRS